jgi:PiT family inorganic phosphate transporter
MLGLDFGMTLILIICILAACTFEFINGFHDTANAVATVIYTNAMKPTVAVIWSGFFNFVGVFFGGIAVAVGIINLLPLSILADQSTAHSIAMILSLILTSIIWNISTWYFGIPCSSSHALIGSIFGVGIAYGLIPGIGAVALHWDKVKDVGLSLLISPLFGFGLTMAMVLLAKRFIKYKKLFAEPKKNKKPPFWIRLILIGTCTSVSYAHGSNDGQKGVGLMMIILIAIVPFHFALNHNRPIENLRVQVNNFETVIGKIDTKALSLQNRGCWMDIKDKIDSVQTMLAGATSFTNLKKENHFKIRKNILYISNEWSQLVSEEGNGSAFRPLTDGDKFFVKESLKGIKGYIEYVPIWILFLISLSLGLGTMIGWKRIVVTIGEKIGKEHLSYVQGASAELVAASTIAVSSSLGLPVSTTHVLSSGVAGSMVATNGLKNLRMKTVKNILIAWLITLPVTIVLSGGLFLLLRYFL